MNIQVLHPAPAQIASDRLRQTQEVPETAANAVTDRAEAPGITAAAPSAGEGGIKADIRDHYLPEERGEGAGLYRMTKDEDGNPVLRFDQPEKAAEEQAAAGKEPSAEEVAKEEAAAKEKKAQESKEREEAKETKTTMNTDRVDREIQQLAEEVEELEQKLRTATGDAAGKLEQKLVLSKIELRIKDNDTYRRAHADVAVG